MDALLSKLGVTSRYRLLLALTPVAALGLAWALHGGTRPRRRNDFNSFLAVDSKPVLKRSTAPTSFEAFLSVTPPAPAPTSFEAFLRAPAGGAVYASTDNLR